jgi:WhiB family redox-sensing transcriptional regulator
METRWQDAAACKGQDPDVWIGPPEGWADTKARKAICATCPVVATCLDTALAKPRWSLGVWGGTSGSERSAMARAMRQVVACGTDVRTTAMWSRFCGDEAIVSDVAVATEAPPHLAAVLAARAELSVVVAVALLARSDEFVAETVTSRRDQPKWLTDMASQIAGQAHGEAKRAANVERMRRVRARRHGLAA